MNQLSNQTIANTILAQLGGNRFIAMVGATHLVSSADSLSMRFMKGRNGVNALTIKLNGNDLYDLQFKKVRGIKCADLDKLEGIDCENLRGVFEKTTGLYTSL